uniref:Uncharacterized protein n=1 Tax=Schlesneria paludicola TaxID=360056 RepID=A0A7C2P5F0_9PLAN
MLLRQMNRRIMGTRQIDQHGLAGIAGEGMPEQDGSGNVVCGTWADLNGAAARAGGHESPETRFAQHTPERLLRTKQFEQTTSIRPADLPIQFNELVEARPTHGSGQRRLGRPGVADQLKVCREA